ncbi:MAG: flagellar hook-basal body complex protein FliE [Pseudomonadota bacterium]
MPLPPTVTQPALNAYAQAAKRADAPASGDADTATPSFGEVLSQSIGEAIEAGKTGENVSIQAASGQSNLQDVVEAVTAAEVSLQTVVSIRDRVLSAYQEIMRMPI